MRRYLLGLLLTVPILAASGCRRAQPPAYRPTATIRDIMISIVDPQADVLWNAVATIIDASGTEERQPKTEEEWATVRRSAVQMVEVSNLLLVPRRQAARRGENSENPGIELEPAAIEKLIAEDPATWGKLVGGLHDAAVPALKAVEAKNVEALFEAGDKLEKACESCHHNYWYPPKNAPAWKK